MTALILIGAVIPPMSVHAETVERIAAVVGNRIILASELANQVQLYLLQEGNSDQINSQEVAKEILQQMVTDELILEAAREDTTIAVSENEVQSEVNDRIASLASRFPNDDAFIAQLEREGLTKRMLEKRLRPQLKDQLLKQKAISRKLAKISVSRQEAELFFAKHRDSLPQLPTKMRLAHILIKYKVSPRTDDSVKHLAELAREAGLGTEDCEAIARQFTDRWPGTVGGRIGYIKKDEVVPEFGRAVFGLAPGGISGPVRTEFGWHIIRCHARLQDSADVSQILFPLVPSVADSARAKQFADSLYQELLGGTNFKELAKVNSDDDSTRGTGGEMAPMTIDQIRPEFLPILEKIDTGQVTTPLSSQAGYHILKLLEREPGRPLDMALDFDIIRNMAKQEKTSRLVEKWVDELRLRTFVDIRELEKN